MTARTPGTVPCVVCGGTTQPAGTVVSAFSRREFALGRCPSCGFGFVVDPRDDYAALYDEAYYGGRGADPLVDYLSEMADPRTVRSYEWRGLARIVTELAGTTRPRVLDYGCGLGGFVRHLRDTGAADAVGFDEGFGATWARDHGIPVLLPHELADHAGTCDVVTAIEVLEHVTDPVAVMGQIASLLKPGGVLFLTTGNAARQRDLTRWSYVLPDIHIAFYEPRTLEAVYRRAGLEPEYAPAPQGFTDVVHYKVLKNLRRHRRNALEAAMPWTVVARAADRRLGLSAHPLGRRPRA